MSLPMVGRHIVTMISAAAVACLCMESAAQAEIFDLACDRIDVRNPVHYLYMTGLSRSGAPIAPESRKRQSTGPTQEGKIGTSIAYRDTRHW